MTKKIFILTVFIFSLAVNLAAQAPQYYNYNNVGTSSNIYPFSQSAGRGVQWLFLPGDFNQPAPLPPGNIITKIWVFVTTGGTRTFTDLTILMAQDTITSLINGTFYTGTLDTVYHKASVTLTGPTNGWMDITLDTPYPYDPTKSLIVMIGQCAATGSGIYVRQNTLTPYRRNWSAGGCPFVPYTNGDGNIVNFGVDVIPLSNLTPDYIYYKFENNPTSTSTPNCASQGVGNYLSPLTNVTLGAGGQFDTCLTGTGQTNSGVTTGWNWNTGTSNWTISMWIQIPTSSSGTAYYLFGDAGLSFRCYHNGSAGQNNLLLRGTGISDVNVTGIGPAPTVVTFVCQQASTTPYVIKAYKNGVLVNTVAQANINLAAGSGFKVGGYSTSSGFIGKMDEFRLYNRALSDAEVLASFNKNLHCSSPPAQKHFASIWCPFNTYPSLPIGTYHQAAAWLGDTLYVQTPDTIGNPKTTIRRYKLGGSWSTGVPCLTAVTGATLTAANGKLYLIGGGTSVYTTGSTNVQEYNPSTGFWTSKAPLPVPMSTHGAINWGDSVIFIVGGPYTGSGTNQAVHYYRIASNTWGTISNSLPPNQGRRSHATAIIGNKIIIAAGYNTVFLKNMFIGTIGSNATQISWTAGPDIPTPWTGISRPGGAGYYPYFFVVAGERAGPTGFSDSTFVFNIKTYLWQKVIDNKPKAVSNIYSAVALKIVNDTVKLFVPGGYESFQFANKTFDVLGCGGIITESKNISSESENYTLNQNYPNPFNPVTKIEFAIPKAGFVTLKVYDMLGREVVVLVNQERPSGHYIVDFDASNLSSGIYFYKLEVNGFKDVKKMTLLK